MSSSPILSGRSPLPKSRSRPTAQNRSLPHEDFRNDTEAEVPSTTEASTSVSTFEITAHPPPVSSTPFAQTRSSIACSSKSSYSSECTVLARTLAIEADYKRRALERQRILAERETEVERLECEAQIQAINAAMSDRSRGTRSKTQSIASSAARTEQWVKDHPAPTGPIPDIDPVDPYANTPTHPCTNPPTHPYTYVPTQPNTNEDPPTPHTNPNLPTHPHTNPNLPTHPHTYTTTHPHTNNSPTRPTHPHTNDPHTPPNHPHTNPNPPTYPNPNTNPPTIPNYNVDLSMIVQAIGDTAAAAKALASASNKPKLNANVNLPTYNGNALEWLQFKRIYENTQEHFSPIENIARLQSALRGAAKEATATLLVATLDPGLIIARLEQSFARPEMIVNQEVTSLKNVPKLTADLKDLPTLAIKISNCVATLRALGHHEYLVSPELYQIVLSKLTPILTEKFYDFATKEGFGSGAHKLMAMAHFLEVELDKHVEFGSLGNVNPITPPQLRFRGGFPKREESVLATTSRELKCVFCRKLHDIRACPDFKKLSVNDKCAWVRDHRICYRCLKDNPHSWSECSPTQICGVNSCRLHHDPSLHREAVPVHTVNEADTENEADTDSTQLRHNVETINASNATPDSYHTLLKIIPVTVTGPNGSCDTFAMLDDGSTATVIDEAVASVIGAEGRQDSIRVFGIGGMCRDVQVSYVSFRIKGKYGKESFIIKNARAMGGLNLRPQTVETTQLSKFEHLADIAHEITYTKAKPTILIGAGDWHLLLTQENRTGRVSEPVGCRTALGWTIYGCMSSHTKVAEEVLTQHTFHTSLSYERGDNSELESLVKAQYQLESLGVMKQSELTKLEQQAVNILESTARRLPTGRYEVGMTWRDDIKFVPDSYYQALNRLKSLDKVKGKDQAFTEAYAQYINGLLVKGYAEECDPSTYHDPRQQMSPQIPLRWYTPHFGVFHPQKKKLRVVNDAACKTHGVSLNSLLLPGPDLLQPLLGLLFRFREGRIALTADIKEMFPQIRIRPQDRDALRFLWTENSNTKEFRMTSVIFGACSSPFTAQFIKNKNALDFKSRYPQAVDAILHDHYMDDYVGSHDNVPTAARIASEIVMIHAGAGFEMSGWISNVSEALHLVPESLRAAQPSEVELCSSQNNIVRALGVAWYPKDDSLGFRTGLGEESIIQLTKRKLLSHLMRVYDPLGLLAPITVKGRILFQQLWRHSNVGWDTPLPQNLAKPWFDWLQELSHVKTLGIPRWYGVDALDTHTRRELHLFADASELAFACVAFFRFVLPDGSVKVALITSKARVSPLKPVSIPRLELQAALIATRVANCIKESHKQKPTHTIFWTDSMTVLRWIRSDARCYKPFVAHRLGEILDSTNVKDWRWLPTKLNVADDATRSKPVPLTKDHRWFTGPQFLLSAEADWPIEPVNAEVPLSVLEVKRSDMVNVVNTELLPCPHPIAANPTRFSDWTRLLRATARAHQIAAFWLNVIRQKSGPNSKSNPPSLHLSPPSHQNVNTRFMAPLPHLTANHLKDAERHVLHQTQLESFAEELRCLIESKPIPKQSRLKNLTPRLGTDNLLRNFGRIGQAPDIPTHTKTPIILDGRNYAVRLLVLHFHRRLAHANNEAVINELRQTYWVVYLRNTVRSVASSCLFCRVKKSMPITPPTADLPTERLTHHERPFTCTGVDYFGPTEVTIGRRHEKRWVALFTCLTTRAVHLEVVNSLSTDSAIMSLRRFIARRGTPNTIFSDNGTNFVGTANELKHFYGSQLFDFAANKGIHWKFIPANAPTFGGAWERLVRSIKTALATTLLHRTPKEETFITFLLEAEAVVNSRPLTHVSVNPDDEEAISPFHFLIGTSSHLTVPPLDDGDLVRRLEWRKALRLADHFWRRWVQEYLPTLQRRQSNPMLAPNFSVGDVVIIADSTLPRGVWPKGRVVATYPGKDGVVRVADILTKGLILKRPTRRLVKLETS